jgi:hypothetical protein
VNPEVRKGRRVTKRLQNEESLKADINIKENK